MSPTIQPFLDRLVHLDCHAHDVCADGVLSVVDGVLTFSGAPGLRWRLDRLEWAYAAPYGPREFADFPDLGLRVDDVFLAVFTVLRDPEFHPIIGD
jgi:hypothetical protein